MCLASGPERSARTSHHSLTMVGSTSRPVSRREEEPMVRKLVAAASAALAIAVATAVGWDAFASASAGSAGIQGALAPGKPIRFEQHDLYIEFNATAGDAGLQLGADA